MANNKYDLKGQKFGKLRVIDVEYDNNVKKWRCECSCKDKTIKLIRASHLVSGSIVSCGCHKAEMARKTMTTHGESKDRNDSKFYNAWQGMKNRCRNSNLKSWEDYGGRGITYSKNWETYLGFKNDMYESYSKHCDKFGKSETSLDRIDVNGNYEKENCRWATNKEQANNTRSNVNITLNERTQTMKQWCDELDINYSTFVTRISKGWSNEEAFELIKKEGHVPRVSRGFEVRAIFKTVNYGDIIITKFSHRKRYDEIHSVRFFEVEFLNTGSKKIVSETCIDSGKIKDNYATLNFGYGFLGDGEPSTHYLYSRWHCMMSKCYNVKDKEYKSNGLKGVHVDVDWHNFQNYIKGITNLKSFNKEKILSGDYIVVKDFNSKIYSKNTCLCLDKLEHNKLKSSRQFPDYKLTNIETGEVEIIKNMKEFCRNNPEFKYHSVLGAVKGKRNYKTIYNIVKMEDVNEKTNN